MTFQASTLLSSGTVQRVDYFRTFVGMLGTATTPPYTYVWTNPPKGTYNVYAWMVDDKGVGRQSQEIQFTVVGPNVPPTVSLTAPANNATFGAPASFNLQATATDSDGINAFDRGLASRQPVPRQACRHPRRSALHRSDARRRHPGLRGIRV